MTSLWRGQINHKIKPRPPVTMVTTIQMIPNFGRFLVVSSFWRDHKVP
jgi:hypothetical protein